jgi:hypothetical protein
MEKREPPSFDPTEKAKPTPEEQGLLGAKGDPAEGKRGQATDDGSGQDRQEERPAS